MTERPSRRTPEEFRALILDAAAECLVEGGFASGRLLSAIARKAGVSRPTLYKYGGTVDDIKEALVERELAAFIEHISPAFDELAWTPEYLTDLLVLVIDYTRHHPLLTAALRDVPELVLPVFTLHARVQVDRIEEFVTPVLRAHIAAGRMPDVDISVLVDALYRVVMAAVIVNTGHDFDDPEVLRSYLGTGLAFLTGLPASR
ncbi:TetR/AcrR family transcriptional regulator [Actinocorallia sp. A-T 12471]|uniref:TetR/AcrR family transcriptional regulator n=1 Tax=Actinocorallia sp. A-T 12471 TaxID=3089813 RepID=UPI0029D263B6|nr:TetR/AcrR family transcriptional regulator [Actinocorallia sp. A-T 12471]MDX6739179.1 TetR/AcrR family transcriptional regulator [Actinocorallia sp. A-T 12471]